MAAQSKTTAVHFSLIFFVMLSVILGVVAYLFRSDYREREAAFTKAQQDLSAANAAGARYIEEIDALKKVVGIEQSEVGVAQPGENTVLALANAAIQRLGTNPSAPSLFVALQDLRAELDKRNVEVAERNATIADLQATVEALRRQYGEVAKTHDDQRVAAEQDLSNVQQVSTEQIASKDEEINQLRDQNAQLQTELAQNQEQNARQVAKLEGDINALQGTNTKLNEELDKIKGESFEVADGRIVRVDQVARTVWINLGADDNLRKRTTFSVYGQNNRGIGRNPQVENGRPEDIKGSIEVVRIIDDHLAEARILDDDSSRPISPGDPIYTPLWSAGRQELFAFSGKIDIDGDGSYVGDRDRLHEILKAVGAGVSSEVTDTGERVPVRMVDGNPVPAPIDEQTRFLVKGHIPDPMSVPKGDERDRLKLMGQHQIEMENEARRSGVRVVNLNTFLDYIGYIPQQRRWVPGEADTWTLEGGGRRPGRSSTGITSGLFDTRRARPQSPGTTSQTFGGEGAQ